MENFLNVFPVKAETKRKYIKNKFLFFIMFISSRFHNSFEIFSCENQNEHFAGKCLLKEENEIAQCETTHEKSLRIIRLSIKKIAL